MRIAQLQNDAQQGIDDRKTRRQSKTCIANSTSKSPIDGRRRITLLTLHAKLSSAVSHRPSYTHIHRRSTIVARPTSIEKPLQIFASATLSRNASTSNATPLNVPPSNIIDPPSSSNLQGDLDSLSLGDIDLNKTALELGEKVGGLKELGVDYGWGPTSVLQWLLESYHITSGLPWWAAIAATALTIRLFTFPLYVRASDSTARMNAMSEVTQPIYNRMQDAQKRGDVQTQQLELRRYMAARREAGISFTAQLTPVVIQGIVGFCGFKLMRKLADLPAPGFTEGGFLWLTDLTIPDGYLIMPAVMALSIHLLVRMGGETGTTATPPAMKSFMLFGMPGLLFLITGWQSGALCIWFATSGAVSIVQAQLLQRPAIRRKLGIAPMFKPASANQPAKSFKEMFDEQMETFGGRKRQTTPPPSTESAESRPPRTANDFMRPRYQAPNLRRTAGGDPAGTIEAKAVSSRSDSPPRPSSRKSRR